MLDTLGIGGVLSPPPRAALTGNDDVEVQERPVAFAVVAVEQFAGVPLVVRKHGLEEGVEGFSFVGADTLT